MCRRERAFESEGVAGEDDRFSPGRFKKGRCRSGGSWRASPIPWFASACREERAGAKKEARLCSLSVALAS